MSDDPQPKPDERVAELEAELSAAQRTIDVLIQRLERAGTTPPTQAECGEKQREYT